ncbi:hypothetical protein Tco_1403275 [Tanacetum coccineum]
MMRVLINVITRLSLLSDIGGVLRLVSTLRWSLSVRNIVVFLRWIQDGIVSGFGIGEVALSTLDVLQRFGFFLQMGFTLILATLDGLDVGLLGDVIGEG